MAPWLAMDLSCYSISSIKEKNFFQHDGVHMHLSVSLYSLNDDVLLFVLRFLLCIFLAVQDSSIGDLVNQSVSQ